MNPPKIIEQALATIIRNRGQIGAGVAIRCWQSLRFGGGWDAEKDFTLPLIDIRCGPPSSDEVERTSTVEASVICATKADDDRDHAQIAALYEATQGVLDDLYAQTFASGSTPVYDEFDAALTAGLGTGFHLGGIAFTDGLRPGEENGANVIGIGLRVSYSRADF